MTTSSTGSLQLPGGRTLARGASTRRDGHPLFTRGNVLDAVQAALIGARWLVATSVLDGATCDFVLDPGEADLGDAFQKGPVSLVNAPQTSGAVISARSPEQMEMEGLKRIDRYANSGERRKLVGASEWEPLFELDLGWRGAALGVMAGFRAAYGHLGFEVEDKGVAVAGHFRAVRKGLKRSLGVSLRTALDAVGAQSGFVTVSGVNVIEVRPMELHAGRAIPIIAREAPPDAMLYSAGSTGWEELHRGAEVHFGGRAFTATVGRAPSHAQLRFHTVGDHLAFLATVAEGRHERWGEIPIEG